MTKRVMILAGAASSGVIVCAGSGCMVSRHRLDDAHRRLSVCSRRLKATRHAAEGDGRKCANRIAAAKQQTTRFKKHLFSALAARASDRRAAAQIARWLAACHTARARLRLRRPVRYTVSHQGGPRLWEAEVTLLSGMVEGDLDQTYIRNVLARHIRNLAQCLVPYLRRRGRPATGAFVLAFGVDKNGRATNTRTFRYGFPDPRVGPCLLRVLRPLRFHKPASGRTWAFFPLKLRTKSPVRVFSTAATDRTALDRKTIWRVLRRHRLKFQFCYESRGAQARNLKGKVVVFFGIGSLGQTVNVAVASTTLKHPPTEKCLLNVVKRVRFPKPEGSTIYLRYPISLKPRSHAGRGRITGINTPGRPHRSGSRPRK